MNAKHTYSFRVDEKKIIISIIFLVKMKILHFNITISGI